MSRIDKHRKQDIDPLIGNAIVIAMLLALALWVLANA
jgi:hypothetical protein